MNKSISILAVCLLAACGKDHTPGAMRTSLVTVIQDVTDSMACSPEADPILGLYDFEEYKNQEAGFRLVLITDKHLNPVFAGHICDDAITEESNKDEEVDYRELRVNAFYDYVRSGIQDFPARYYSHGSSLGHSECFATIAHECALLAASKAENRVLLIFSDIQENTDLFSCYTPKGQYLLEHSPDKVAKLLLQQHPLPEDMQGIRVCFVYYPSNRDEDIRFSRMEAVYQQLLAARGAHVSVQATNKGFDL